jgi:hypothetical protein
MSSKLNEQVAVVAGALNGINAEIPDRERTTSTSVQLSSRVQATGQALARYGLALVIGWTRDDVLRAIKEYDRLGPERFFSDHGFAPTTTYELAWEKRRYPPKAILGTAYEFATGKRLRSGDFEGGKTGAVKVLGELGFTVQQKRRPAR